MYFQGRLRLCQINQLYGQFKKVLEHSRHSGIEGSATGQEDLFRIDIFHHPIPKGMEGISDFLAKGLNRRLYDIRELLHTSPTFQLLRFLVADFF